MKYLTSNITLYCRLPQPYLKKKHMCPPVQRATIWTFSLKAAPLTSGHLLAMELRHVYLTHSRERWGSCTHKGRSSNHRSRAAPRRDTAAPAWPRPLHNNELEPSERPHRFFSLASPGILDPSVDAPHWRDALGSHPTPTPRSAPGGTVPITLIWKTTVPI